jgi:hypothetical protein
MTRNIVSALAVASALLSILVPASGDVLSEIPEKYRSGVSRALGGANGAQLRACFEKLEGEERVGYAFLLATMPPHQVRKLTEPILTEHLKYAYKARAELPWAEAVPEGVFHHYVLPILSGDEKVEAWRKLFYEEVSPRLRKKGCRTLTQVAVEVNRWCGSKVSFKGTPPEDSSPLEVMKRGYGRCEEEGIFFNAVARSVGLPARVASTPYWTFKASNHAWCEVYTGAGKKKGARPWHYLGACEPAGRLDQAWFSNDIKRAALVLSRSIGEPEGDSILARQGSGSVINTTRYYTKTCQMKLVVTDGEGKAVPEAAVAFYIFNEVGNEPYMRSVFESKADEKGEFAFDLGPGDYLVHAQGFSGTGFAVARSAPGKKAECRIVLGRPAPGIGTTGSKSGGASGLRLLLGPGAKDSVAGICSLGTFPLKPERLEKVGRAGLSVDLSPGRYVVQTSRRKGDAAVHLTLQVVEVGEGEVATVAVPGRFPKKPAKGENKTGAYLLTYPRK